MIPEKIEEPGRNKALAFTVLVHTGLIAALFFGVQWKRNQPDVVEVELWSSRPASAVQAAPPPPPPPPQEVKPEPKPEPKPVPKVEPPPPKKPDIAIKEEKKLPKPEPKKPEPEAKPEPRKPEPKKPEAKPAVKSEPALPDFSKELASETAQLKSRPNTTSTKQMTNAAAAEAEQRAASGKRGMLDYAAKIRGKVRGNIVLPPNIQGNPEAIFEVNQLPSGEVLDVKLKRSSGNHGLDTAIERAILKSSPLPKPDDPALFQRVLEIKYRPNEE
jgi:colicin import membrane protein